MLLFSQILEDVVHVDQPTSTIHTGWASGPSSTAGHAPPPKQSQSTRAASAALSCAHLLRMLRSRKQCGHSLLLHALPASETPSVDPWRHCIMYCCLSKGSEPPCTEAPWQTCLWPLQTILLQWCLQWSRSLPSNIVSEIRCHSCQSSTIHLTHKAIGCDSKHSPTAKPILKNYLKANCWKTHRLLQMVTVRPVPVLICLRFVYKVT